MLRAIRKSRQTQWRGGGNRAGRGRFGGEREGAVSRGGKSWSARREGRGVCVCDLGWGRSKVAPQCRPPLPAETRLSALFPSRHPIGGGGGGGGPPLETGPQLRTHRLAPSSSLSLSRACPCVCVVSRDQCQGQCHGCHGAATPWCWVAGFRPTPALSRSMSPDHER